MKRIPVRRGLQITKVLTKYGFSQLSHSLFGKKEDTAIVDETSPRAVRMRKVVEELGPVFIKFAQMLTLRTDILPPDIIEEFKKFEDKVESQEIHVKDFVEKELGVEWQSVFVYINEDPIGVASIAQVYRAALLDGTRVVLKIKKPGTDKTVREDVTLMKELIKLYSIKGDPILSMNLQEMIRSFEQTIKEELDFNNELFNIQKYRQQAQGDSHVHVPDDYIEYCTENLITMEELTGSKIISKHVLAFPEKVKEEICDNLIEHYLNQMLNHGFFHADPHPGNIFVDNEYTIKILDFGLMGLIPKNELDKIIFLLIKVTQGDVPGIIKLIKEIAVSIEVRDEKQFELDLQELLERVNTNLNSISSLKLGTKMNQLLFENKIRLPGYFLNLGRALGILDGIVRQLNPGINLMEYIKPRVIKYFINSHNPKDLVKKYALSIFEVEKFLSQLPYLSNSLSEQLVKGELQFKMSLKEEAKFRNIIGVSSMRIAMGIVMGTMIISGTLFIINHIGPKLWGMSILGMVFLAFSLCMTLVYLFYRYLKMERDV